MCSPNLFNNTGLAAISKESIFLSPEKFLVEKLCFEKRVEGKVRLVPVHGKGF